jgi:SAM-dependent methyltransferase
MKKFKIEKKLYKNRFATDMEQRNKLWKVLCKDFLQKYISSKDVVLDIPSGYGEFINNINCKQKIACDINSDSKKYVNANVTFILGSSVKISLKENSVDKVFISNFFEHITREDIIKTIVELKKIVKPGGKILILQPNVRFCHKDYWMFFDHSTPIDDRALKEIFELNGFRLLYKIEKFLPYTTKDSSPKHAVLLRIYLKFSLLWRFFGKQSFLVFEK